MFAFIIYLFLVIKFFLLLINGVQIIEEFIQIYDAEPENEEDVVPSNFPKFADLILSKDAKFLVVLFMAVL